MLRSIALDFLKGDQWRKSEEEWLDPSHIKQVRVTNEQQISRVNVALGLNHPKLSVGEHNISLMMLMSFGTYADCK